MIRLNTDLFSWGRAHVPDLQKLLGELQVGEWENRKRALAKLIAAHAEEELTQCLASADARTAQLAAAGLWECWLNEEGVEARAVIDRGIDLMEEGQLASAEKIFRDLSLEYPGWAEPVNKRASLLFGQGWYRKSFDLSHWVVELKPSHFAAWHGLALCAVELHDWHTALTAAKEGLRLQPRYNANRDIIEVAKEQLGRRFR